MAKLNHIWKSPVRWLRLALVGLASVCLSTQLHAAAPDEIITIHQLKNLTPEQSALGHPVHLTGVVLCYDSGWNQLYVCDGHETGYFNSHDFLTQPQTGQLVEIFATTAAGNSLTNAKLSVLGPGAIPDAKKLELSQLGGDWSEWIETTGQVLSAENSSGRLALLLQANSQNCLVYVLGAVPGPRDLKRFVGSNIRVRGINASKIVDGHLESATVFAPGMSEITVLASVAPKSAPVPVASIGSLLNRELGSWTNTAVHINGLIVSYQPGKSLVVKDPTGVIRAQVIQFTQIQPDERVDVWGFLQVSPTEVFLDNAYFEVAQAPAQNDSLAVAPGAAAVATNLPVLTQVSDILKLRREESAQHIPVRLQGVITYADPDWRNGFFQDKGGAVYVDMSQADVRSGQHVELTGHTSSGGFSPEILGSAITILGDTNFPTPAKVDLVDLANGRLDAHWVQMDGVIRRVDQQWGHLSLSLMTPQGRFKVIIPGFDNGATPTNLIDALVSVTGACTSELNAHRQLSGITLHAPSLEQVKILEPPAADPFSITTTPIDAVATFDPDRLAGRRVKVRGVVTLRIQAQGFIVADASGGIRVLTRQSGDVQVGDIVDVLGFPVIGDFSPYLEEASFRKTGTGLLLRRQANVRRANSFAGYERQSRGRNQGAPPPKRAALRQSATRAAGRPHHFHGASRGAESFAGSSRAAIRQPAAAHRRLFHPGRRAP